jgi:hypothetical protein
MNTLACSEARYKNINERGDIMFPYDTLKLIAGYTLGSVLVIVVIKSILTKLIRFLKCH